MLYPVMIFHSFLLLTSISWMFGLFQRGTVVNKYGAVNIHLQVHVILACPFGYISSSRIFWIMW